MNTRLLVAFVQSRTADRHKSTLCYLLFQYLMMINDFVQSKAHEEAMGGLIKGGYIKTCTAGDLPDIAHDATWLFLSLHCLLLWRLFCVRP